VEYVEKIFPSAQFIHLIRDGRDVCFSSMVQWQAPIPISRLIKKIKYVPLKALPTYSMNYLLSYLARYISKDKQISSWGVVPKDLKNLVARYSLLEVCACQWKRSVEATLHALEAISEEQQLEVRYESFVQDPQKEMERILGFLGLEMSEEVLQHLKARVKPGYKDNWKSQIDQGQEDLVMNHISSTLNHLGYVK